MHADADSWIEVSTRKRYCNWKSEVEETAIEKIVCKIDITFVDWMRIPTHAATVSDDKGTNGFEEKDR